MQYTRLSIPDLILLTPQVFGDERGLFFECFRQDDFSQHCGEYHFVQDNQSRSAKGVLRGLHYQLQQTQGKLVRVTKGEVYDVAVDMRRSSPTFGQWAGVWLNEDNKQMLWVPPGFAHGFYVVSDIAEFHYKCTDYYAPQFEHSLLWNDPNLAIDWPLNGEPPIVGHKDEQATLFDNSPTFA